MPLNAIANKAPPIGSLSPLNAENNLTRTRPADQMAMTAQTKPKSRASPA